jgi:hypothetical protein
MTAACSRLSPESALSAQAQIRRREAGLKKIAIPQGRPRKKFNNFNAPVS